jgi:glycine/sarcosine/betaine reductase complex component C subunit beta
MHTVPTVRAVAQVLAHVPDFVIFGSKPSRELERDPSLRDRITGKLRAFEAARDYMPNQIFIGNREPTDLGRLSRPWWRGNSDEASRFGHFGEIMPQDDFLGLMRIVDDFHLLWLEERFCERVRSDLVHHPLIRGTDLEKLGAGATLDKIHEKVASGDGLPIIGESGGMLGCMLRDHPVDEALTSRVLLENLACKASGVLALRHLLWGENAPVPPESIDYLLGCGEEAVGDRYQRGGGSLGKAIGEAAGCINATGSDLKAFCSSPVHSLVTAGAFVRAGVFQNVVVVAGGSLPKLGMKFMGHLAHDMPIIEDVLGGFAALVGRDDGRSPRLLMDGIGRHTIGSGSTQQDILNALVTKPLAQCGLRITDVDKYATELHNPEVTEPAGSGDIPRVNYRMIGSLAVTRGEIARDQVDAFVQRYGMPGFAPSQGHIASAVPYLGHACRGMKAGRMHRALFLAKGSLFLGRMTQLADGMSILVESANGG